MTPAQVLQLSTDGIALNDRQRLLIANPTAETDSIVEHIRELVRTATREQRPHLRALLELVRDLANDNGLEGEHLREIAHISDLQATARKTGNRPLSKRPFVDLVRDPLANLVNPFIKGAARDKAHDQVVKALARTTPEIALHTGVSREIGPKRYAALREIVASLQSREQVAA